MPIRRLAPLFALLFALAAPASARADCQPAPPIAERCARRRWPSSAPWSPALDRRRDRPGAAAPRRGHPPRNLCTATPEWRDQLAALRPASALVVEPATTDAELPVALLALAGAAVVAVLIGAWAFARR